MDCWLVDISLSRGSSYLIKELAAPNCHGNATVTSCQAVLPDPMALHNMTNLLAACFSGKESEHLLHGGDFPMTMGPSPDGDWCNATTTTYDLLDETGTILPTFIVPHWVFSDQARMTRLDPMREAIFRPLPRRGG